MKRQKKISALLLTFIMILTFAACGSSKADTADAAGTWSMKLDLSAALKEDLGSEFADFDAPFVFTLCLDLNKDGSYKMYIDQEQTEKDMEAFITALADFFAEYLLTTMESQGFDRATAQAALEAQLGMPVTDYSLETIRANMDIAGLASSMVQEGVYKISGGKFYMGEAEIDKKVYDLISIDGDTLTLNMAEDASASPFFNGTIPGLSYPFELTRVK